MPPNTRANPVKSPAKKKGLFYLSFLFHIPHAKGLLGEVCFRPMSAQFRRIYVLNSPCQPYSRSPSSYPQNRYTPPPYPQTRNPRPNAPPQPPCSSPPWTPGYFPLLLSSVPHHPHATGRPGGFVEGVRAVRRICPRFDILPCTGTPPGFRFLRQQANLALQVPRGNP